MRKPPKKAPPPAKKVAPVKATSGAGFAIEDKVAAVCTAAILLGRSPFAALPGRVSRIGFQVRVDGWHFDDILLTCEHDGATYRAALSVRSKTEFTSKAVSSDLRNALAAQFDPTGMNPFQQGRDRLGLVSARHGEKVSGAIRDLCAAASADPSALARRIEEAGAFKPEARALFADLQAHFAAHTVPADAAAAFASFDLVELDMDDFARAEPLAGRQLCAELLHDPADANVIGLWQALVAECQRQKQQAGYLDHDRLLAAVRHRFRLKGYPHDAPDWIVIDRESRGLLDLVIDTTADHMVKRKSAHAALRSAVGEHHVTALVGPSGCGKSSLAKQLCAKSDYPVLVWTRASSWSQPQAGTLANALGYGGLAHDLRNLFQRVASPALLVIDAVEHCADPDRLAQLARVIELAKPGDANTPWRVLLIARAEDWSQVREQLATLVGEIAVYVEHLADFSAEDVGEIARIVPGLAPLVLQPRLESVLRKPKILSLVANHLKAGGAVDERDLAGESHLAQWWWKTRIRTGSMPAQRARALDELVAKQAERVQHAVPENAFDPVLLEAFQELVRDGICISRNQEFAVQHDLYADWTRLDLLIRQDEQWVAFASDRLTSPLWHRAVRLYGIWLLEQAQDGAALWARHVAALANGDDAAKMIADLFLEAPLLSAAPVDNLRLVWSHLVADRSHLLHRMLERMRVTATAPNEALIEFVVSEGGLIRDELLAHLRLPYPQYWLPLLVVLHEYAAQAAELAPVSTARTALAWLDASQPAWPGRKEAAELAVQIARPFVDRPDGEVWFPNRDEEDIIYQALLAAVHECPDDVARLVRVLAGLRPRGGGEFTGEGEVTIKSGFGPGAGMRYKLPPPWPGGPFVRPNSRFQRLVLQTNALNPLISANPALAREIILAVHIPEREPEHRRNFSGHEPDGIAFDESFQAPFYTRGPYLRLLQVNQTEGLRLVVDLVNHYTDRWIEWSRSARELTIGEGPGAQLWKGDQRLYFAYRGASPCNAFVVSALMALEKHLLDRVDKAEKIDNEVAYLLANSRSLAIAGLLVALGKRQFDLLLTTLWEFVASPELQSTEFYYYATGGAGGERPSSRALQKLIAEWDELPIHRVPLHDACAQLLPYKSAQPKLTALSAKWRKMLEEPSKLPVDGFILLRFVELFDLSNWTQSKEGDHVAWEYHIPPRLLEAAAKRQAERQGDLMSLLTVPVTARSLLDAGKPLPESELERWFNQLDLLPQGTIRDDDGESSIGSSADAECAIVAVLIKLGGTWLDRHPENAKRCGAILLKHLAAPPPPRRFIFDDAPFNLIWENFCAEAAPYFLARDTDSKEWRTAVAELAGRSHLQTVRGLFRSSAHERARLGPFFDQMVHLAIWIAAARHVLDLSEHDAEPVLDWSAWWPAMRAQFVDASVPMPPDDWQMIDVAPGKNGRYRNDRFGPRVKIGTIMAVLEPLGTFEHAESEAARIQWHTWKCQLLAAIVAALPKTIVKSEEPRLPSQPELLALLHLGAHLAGVAGPAERRQVWKPLLALGESAAHYIRYFLQGFLNTGARASEPAFLAGWNELLAWAETAPGWTFSETGPSHEMRTVWWTLLGLDDAIIRSVGAAPPSTITGLKGFYERWAGHDLARSGSTQRFLNFLRMPAAADLLADGLHWLDSALDAPAERRWALRRLASELSNFLQWTWANHESRVRARPAAFDAFRRLLLRLGIEQDQAAIALLSRITSSP